MNIEFVTPELEVAKELIEEGSGKKADQLLRSEVTAPPRGNDRWRWARFLRDYCNTLSNKRSALPSGIKTETLRQSGVPVVMMPMQESDASNHLRATIDTLMHVQLDMEVVEQVNDDPSFEANLAGHSHLTISKQDTLLFADAVAPHTIGTAGSVTVYWLVDQPDRIDRTSGTATSYRSGWLTNALVEIISHGAEYPVNEGTHLTIRMSIQVTDAGKIINALPMIADKGHGIEFGRCICQ